MQVWKAVATVGGEVRDQLTDGMPVPNDILDAFEERNIQISADATISLESPNRWKLTSGGREYLIADDVNLLTISEGSSQFSSVSQPVRIEAGGTLYSQYVSEQVFKVEVDVIITTNGQFLIAGKGIVANGAIEADIKLYGDLSSLDDANPDRPLQLLFLANLNTGELVEGSTPLLRLKGEMTFAFKDINGNLINPSLQKPDSFEFRVLGRAELAPAEFAKVIIGGSPRPRTGPLVTPRSN